MSTQERPRRCDRRERSGKDGYMTLKEKRQLKKEAIQKKKEVDRMEKWGELI